MAKNTDELRADADSFPRPRNSACPFDPPPDYGQWREEHPITPVVTSQGSLAWLFTRHQDARDVLGNRTVSSQRWRTDLPMPKQGGPLDLPPLNRTFVSMDPPEHSRIRRLLAKDYMAKHIDAMRPRIQQLVDEQLDQMIAQGAPGDLVSQFALPLPSLITCWMLGVPYSEHENFQDRTGILANRSTSVEEKQGALSDLLDMLGKVAELRLRDPQDDIMSRLAELVPAGEMTVEEVAASSIVLLIAGHESTASQIALGTLALLRNPEQLRLLHERPDLIANGVEELLRYATIAQLGIDRVATEDFEVGGKAIRRGDGILVSLPAANRDPEQFPDPDTLDVTRSNARKHVAFGYGVHQCVGHYLARTELQIAMGTLLRRLPGLRLAVPFDELEFKHELAFFGVYELPVAW